jgi:hypothetical protein
MQLRDAFIIVELNLVILLEIRSHYLGPRNNITRDQVKQVVNVYQDLIVLIDLLLRALVYQLVVALMQLGEHLHHLVYLIRSYSQILVRPAQTEGDVLIYYLRFSIKR